MIALALYGTYIIFILLPAHSPRFVFYTDVNLEGGWIAQAINRFLIRASYPGGAFPSGHAAVSIAICIFMWRYARIWAVPIIFVTLLLLLATVYSGYHYVVDIIAGFLYGAAASYATVAWNRKHRNSRAMTPAEQ